MYLTTHYFSGRMMTTEVRMTGASVFISFLVVTKQMKVQVQAKKKGTKKRIIVLVEFRLCLRLCLVASENRQRCIYTHLSSIDPCENHSEVTFWKF